MVNSLEVRRKCAVSSCFREAVRGRRQCHCHIKRAWRAAHPVMAQYSRLKAKARARGIAFTLTKEDWEKFCAITGYTGAVGCRFGADMQCDRIDSRRGYHRDNIQALSFALNSAKAAGERAWREDELVAGPF